MYSYMLLQNGTPPKTTVQRNSAYRLIDYTTRDTPHKHPRDTGRNTKAAGLSFRASSYDLRVYIVSDGERHSIGAPETHIDEILGRGEGRIMGRVRNYVTRQFGLMGIQETALTHADMEYCAETGILHRHYAKNVR